MGQESNGEPAAVKVFQVSHGSSRQMVSQAVEQEIDFPVSGGTVVVTARRGGCRLLPVAARFFH